MRDPARKTFRTILPKHGPQGSDEGYPGLMPIAKLVRNAGNVAVARVTWGGEQNFLGAQWVASLLENSPARFRERAALRLLSLSPHYFYDRDVRAEAERNRQSRQDLVNELVAPYVSSASRVIDYGCGPGYMARAVAGLVSHVDAVDISPGVLACAKVLNRKPNIDYITPDELTGTSGMADLAYSFAVVQHLRTETLAGALGLLARKIRPGGTLLIHFAVPDQGGWRTEAGWKADQSFTGRVRLRYGLNCFGRSVEEMKSLIASSGFTDIDSHSLAGSFAARGDDDITCQHLATATRQLTG
jgi:SAM-dependent methyltransferase